MTPVRSIQPEIEVLLATFNGAQFLPAQIDSILGQNWHATRILARDDGSTDATPDLLAEYAARFPDRFRVLPTDSPTGSARLNFKILLRHSTAPWVAFADQDDVWLPQKLELAAAAMSRLEQTTGMHRPLLVFTDLEVVNQELVSIHRSFWRYEGLNPANVHRLQRLLLQNVVTGCTMLVNRPMVEMAALMPFEALMHDHWIALLACVFGNAESIAQPLVRYRQHAANVVGAKRPMTVVRFVRALSHHGRHRQWMLTEGQATALMSYAGRDGEVPSLTTQQEATILAFLRCSTSPRRLTRVVILLRHGFVYSSLRRTVALVWSLWKKKPAGEGKN